MTSLKSIFLGLGCIALLLGSCKKKPSSTPPSPAQACANLGFDIYNCEDGNPGALLFNGKGGLKLSVVSDNVVQFSQVTLYTPSTFGNPSISYLNGTGNAGAHYIAQAPAVSQLHFNVPNSDSYTIKAYYIEYGISAPAAATGNTATCSNPTSTTCYRWYKMVSLASGAKPDCNSFSVVINNQDPAGFIGPCQ